MTRFRLHGGRDAMKMKEVSGGKTSRTCTGKTFALSQLLPDRPALWAGTYDRSVHYSEVEQYFNISVYEVSREKELDVLLVCLVGKGWADLHVMAWMSLFIAMFVLGDIRGLSLYFFLVYISVSYVLWVWPCKNIQSLDGDVLAECVINFPPPQQATLTSKRPGRYFNF